MPLWASGGQEATTTEMSKGPVTLAFWAIGGRLQVDVLNQMFAEFKKEFPNVTTELTMNGNWEEHFQKILVSVAGGSPPDLIRSKDFWVAEFASRNAIEDLSAWVAKDKGKNISVDKEKFHPMRWQTAIYKGKLYSLPWTTFPETFFYNKKLLGDAGLNRGPDNWAEYRDFAKKTTNADKKQWGSILYTYTRVSPAMTEFWELKLMQAGGMVMNKEWTEFTVNTPAGLEALQFELDMIYKDKSMLPPEFSSLTQPTERGQIAMWYSGPWLFLSLPKNFPDLQFVPMLMPQNKNRGVYGIGNNLVMFKDSKHKAETWELLKFMFREENDLKWNSLGGYLPSRIENFQQRALQVGQELEGRGRAVPAARHRRAALHGRVQRDPHRHGRLAAEGLPRQGDRRRGAQGHAGRSQRDDEEAGQVEQARGRGEGPGGPSPSHPFARR